ncbi:uncharacterized protein LOC134839774 isoform X2 [Symsagittifera roscoffensis]|uniref:uncharacterized protein LOC134839774 isoform X2 n=1 Tax=Symsagittifera roscoffensis TaxID=84072 RepID=UPI00307B6F34
MPSLNHSGVGNERPTCQEECPEGFEKISGLSHCYKLLLPLGPVSQDKAVAACGFEGGSTVLTFDSPGEDQVVRDHFFAHYHKAIQSDQAYLHNAGFWTGYVRMYGNVTNQFLNMYSGLPMDEDLFRPGQPDNIVLGSWGEEACVARKKFSKETLNRNGDQGLDDYTCGFPQWVICMQRDVFGLNKRAYNTALMDGVQLPTGRQCELDWTQQNLYQLTMLKDKQLAKGLDEAIELADRYTEILNSDAIRSPTCPVV